MSLEQFYDLNPIGVIDQNKWAVYHPEVALAFRRISLYTPLVDWDADISQFRTQDITEFELFEGDVDHNPIPLTANYIDAAYVPDSRSRQFAVDRYGGKVQVHKSSSYFQQWKLSGGNDWKPMMREVLGDHIVRLHEALSRNVWFKGPKNYWIYSGVATDFATVTAKFELDKVNLFNFVLGNTGSPVIPGDQASAKVAIIPPGAAYDLFATIATASQNEASMWRDAQIYAGQAIRNEIGTFKGIRFVAAPSDKFGINPNVLYNCGAITKQFGVIEPINVGDGAPDPVTTLVDGVWKVGQKAVTHYLKLEDFATNDYNINDFVTIHTKTSAAYGVTGGVDPFDGRTIVRRIVAVDATNNTISFDRPVSIPYTAAFNGKSVTGNVDKTLYAYVTRGKHIGFALVLGSRGGVKGKVLEPLKLYEPKPVDDFESVWRFTYDELIGVNMAEPNMFMLYFFAVSLPKPGGVIAP